MDAQKVAEKFSELAKECGISVEQMAEALGLRTKGTENSQVLSHEELLKEPPPFVTHKWKHKTSFVDGTKFVEWDGTRMWRVTKNGQRTITYSWSLQSAQQFCREGKWIEITEEKSK